MNHEIERKFLVTGNFKHLATQQFPIKQGYLSTDPERTVRIRTKGNKAYLTIKGKSDTTGKVRLEWEHEILIDEAEVLLKLCHQPLIEKIRHIVPYNNQLIEVDLFLGDNHGLILAEIELSHPDDPVTLPPWIGDEVTGDQRYYNSYLSNHSFTKWPK